MFSARTVVEEFSVSAYIEEHKGAYKRLEDVYESIKWRLARAPEQGFQLTENPSKMFLLKTVDRPAISMPAVIVLYSFNDNEVNIAAIKVC